MLRQIALQSKGARRVVALSRVQQLSVSRSPYMLLPGATRGLGVFDRASQSINDWRDRQSSKKSKGATTEELSKALLDYLKKCDKFGMKEYKDQLEDVMRLSGVSGWRSALRTKEEQRELDEKFSELKVAQALTEEEMEDPRLIRRRAKLRIATELGMDVSTVNRFLRSYNETKETHRWLQARKRDGYSLPETQDEYVRMLFEDKTHTKQKRIQRSQGRVRSWRSMMR